MKAPKISLKEDKAQHIMDTMLISIKYKSTKASLDPISKAYNTSSPNNMSSNKWCPLGKRCFSLHSQDQNN